MKTESPARASWKFWHRRMRVIRRETQKAAMDAMVYGTCVMCVPEDGSDPYRVDPTTIPPEETNHEEE